MDLPRDHDEINIVFYLQSTFRSPPTSESVEDWEGESGGSSALAGMRLEVVSMCDSRLGDVPPDEETALGRRTFGRDGVIIAGGAVSAWDGLSLEWDRSESPELRRSI